MRDYTERVGTEQKIIKVDSINEQVQMDEAQAAYLRKALEQLRDRGAGAIEVRPEVEAASDRAVQARFAGTAWTQCDSWYRDERGRIVANWPGYMREYLEQTSELDASEYRFEPLPQRVAADGGPPPTALAET